MRKGAPPPRFDLSLLGGFELTGPNGVVDLPSKKIAGLLTYLACTAPKAQLRERLSALLWGSYFKAQAKQNLRQALYRLRSVLGQDTLESDGESVSLNTAVVQCDVNRFEVLVRDGSRDALSAAVDYYRGHLIDDIAINEEGWSEWLTSERERLLELALGAMMRLGEQELAAGRAEHALRAGQRAAALNNMREDAHRLIVRALSAAGRKAEALRHYKDLVALLKRELNTEPDGATRSLVANLARTQPQSRFSVVSEIAEPALLRPDQPLIAMLPLPNMNRDPEDEVIAEKRAAAGDLESPAVAGRPTISDRRQLTIMVCTMVASTPLSADLDPEEMSERIAPFHKVVADVAARFDGCLAQYLGDVAHLYFGYPAAHEHDVERAVRAGLALLDAVSKLRNSPDITLQARASIATGLVVIGDQSGTDNTRQRIAIGEPPNLAALLQAVAAPGELVIAANTRRLVGGMFDCSALGANELKGLPPQVEAWRVLGETPGVSRFEARRAGALTPLIGRQEEMELLLRRWDQAKTDEGRVVLISGEPGIGKSRLAETLLTRLEGGPPACQRYFCSPHYTQSPLYPFIAQLERAASFAPGDSAEAKLRKLEALFNHAASNAPRALRLIADLLSVPTGGRYPAVEVGPHQKREMTLSALLHQLEDMAAQSPVLIVFEDAHWIDPTSLDLLNRMVDCIAKLPVLMVVTFRPEFQPTWIGQPHVTMLPLSRLSQRDSAGIIGGAAQGKTLPEVVVKQILAHTDGVPLFIEELTITLLESGHLRETADGYVLDGALPSPAIPTTLQSSLLARLDRLASVKNIAQIGAAIGREFSFGLIAAVSATQKQELAVALGKLQAAELIFQRGTLPEATYVFKHALVQDAAYSSLVRSRKQQIHRMIARAIREHFPEMVATEPETIAHHCAAGGIFETAIDYWVKAGDNCLSRFAYLEAIKHLEQAVALLKRLNATPKTLKRELEILLKMVSPLLAIRGPGSREVETLYLRARALIDELGDTAQRYPVLWGLWFAHFIRGEYAAAQEAGATLLEAAQPSGDEGQILEAHHALWALLSVRGNTLEAIEHMRRGSELYDQKMHASQALLYAGHDPGVCCRYHLAKDLWITGQFEHSLHALDEALQLADQLKHPMTTAVALLYATWVHYQRKDRPAMRKALTRLVSLTTEHNLVPTGEMARVMQRVDDCSDRLTLIELHAKFIAARSVAQGTNWHREFCIFMMAERCLELGYPEDGITFLASISTGELEGFYGPEIHRLEGELRLRLPNRDKPAIETCFRTALTRAMRGSAKSFELRAATSMARFLREEGKPSNALNILLPIYEWFSEGADLQDIKNARNLLDDIRASK